MRDGAPRALARRALADRLPAAVLDAPLKGYQAADWHEGLTAARDEIAAEVERLAACAPASAALSPERMRQLVRDWPEYGWDRHEVVEPLPPGAAARHLRRPLPAQAPPARTGRGRSSIRMAPGSTARSTRRGPTRRRRRRSSPRGTRAARASTTSSDCPQLVGPAASPRAGRAGIGRLLIARAGLAPCRQSRAGRTAAAVRTSLQSPLVAAPSAARSAACDAGRHLLHGLVDGEARRLLARREVLERLQELR